MKIMSNHNKTHHIIMIMMIIIVFIANIPIVLSISSCQMSMVSQSEDNTYIYISNQFNTIFRLTFYLYPAYQSYQEFLNNNCNNWSFTSGKNNIPSLHYCYPNHIHLICYFKLKSSSLPTSMPIFLYSQRNFIKAFQPIKYHSNYQLDRISNDILIKSQNIMERPEVVYNILFKNFARRDKEKKYARLKVVANDKEFQYVFGKIVYESFMQDTMKMPFGLFLNNGLIREINVINYMNHEDYRFHMGRIFDVNSMKNDTITTIPLISHSKIDERYYYNPITVFKPINNNNHTLQNDTNVIAPIENFILSINLQRIIDRPIYIIFKEIIWKQTHSFISFNITTVKPINSLTTTISISTYQSITFCSINNSNSNTPITPINKSLTLITCYPKRISEAINSPCNITIFIPPITYTFKCLIQQETPQITQCAIDSNYTKITCQFSHDPIYFLITNETLKIDYNNIPLNYITSFNDTSSSFTIKFIESINDISNKDTISLCFYSYTKTFKLKELNPMNNDNKQTTFANIINQKATLSIAKELNEQYALHQKMISNRKFITLASSALERIPKKYLPDDYLISITENIEIINSYLYGKDIIMLHRYNLLKSKLDKSFLLLPLIRNNNSNSNTTTTTPTKPSSALSSLGKFLSLTKILYIDNDLSYIEIFSYKKSYGNMLNQTSYIEFYVQSDSLATDKITLNKYYLLGTQFNLMVIFLKQYQLSPSIYHLMYRCGLFSEQLTTFEVREIEMISSIFSLEYDKVDSIVIINGVVDEEDYHHLICFIRLNKRKMAYLVKIMNMINNDGDTVYYCDVYSNDEPIEVILFMELKGHLRVINSKQFITTSTTKMEATSSEVDINERINIDYYYSNKKEMIKKSTITASSSSSNIIMSYVFNYTITQCDTDENLLQILLSKLSTFLSSYILSPNDLSHTSILIINNNIINFEFASITPSIPYYCLINNKYIAHALPFPSITANYPILSCQINHLLPQLFPSSSNTVCLYNSNPVIIPNIINLLHCKKLLIHPMNSIHITNIKYNQSASSILFNINQSIIKSLHCLIESKTNSFTSIINCNNANFCKCDYSTVINTLPLTSYKWFLSLITIDNTINPIKIPLIYIKMYPLLNVIQLSPPYIIRDLQVQNITLTTTNANDVFFNDDMTQMQTLSACKITTNIKTYVTRIIYSTPHPQPNKLKCLISLLFNPNEDSFTISYVYDYSSSIGWSYENKVIGNFPILSYPSISSKQIIVDYSMNHIELNGFNFVMSPLATLTTLTYYFYIEIFLFPCNVITNTVIRCTLASKYFFYSHPLITSGSLSIMESRFVYPSTKLILFPIVDDITMRLSNILVSSKGGTRIIISFGYNDYDNDSDDNRSSISILHHMLKYNKIIKVYYHNLITAEADLHYDKLANEFYFTTPNIDNILISSNISYLQSHIYIYFLRVDSSLNNGNQMPPNIFTQSIASITLKNISIKRYFSMTMNLKQTVLMTNLFKPSNSIRFMIRHIEMPSVVFFSTKQYIISAEGDKYDIYWDLNEFLYIGEYCIGVYLNNEDNEGEMYCSEENNIMIYAQPVLENMICFKSYQIISIVPSTIFQGGWFNVYHYPSGKLPPTIIFHLDPNDITISCTINHNLSFRNTRLHCDIPIDLPYGEYGFGFMQENIKGTIKTITMISNSIRLIIIRKPIITSIDSFSFTNDDQKYLKVTIDNNTINKGIKSRLTIYNTISSTIHDPYKKYNEDLIGIYYDPNTILCKKNKDIIAGDTICLMITFNNFHEYISSCGYESTMISKYYIIVDYEPKAIPFIYSNSRLIHLTMNKALIVNKRIQCLFEYIEDYFLIEGNIDSGRGNVLICKVPLMKYDLMISRQLKVKMVIDRHINRDNDVIVELKPLLIIDNVIPREMSSEGGMRMVIYGRNVISKGMYKCKFVMFKRGDTGPGNGIAFEVNAIIDHMDNNDSNKRKLYCITPDTSALFTIDDSYLYGELIISEVDGRYEHHNHFYIEAYLPITIISASPNHCYIDKNMYILLKGTNFRNKLGLNASFSLSYNTLIQSFNSKPMYIDSSTLIITTPTIFEYPPDIFQSYPIILYLSITNNGKEYSPDPLPITFYTHPILISIVPNLTYHSGSIVTITGIHFTSLITHCIFGDDANYSLATVVSASLITCIIPSIFASKETIVNIYLMSKSTHTVEVFDTNILQFTFLNLILLLQEDINPTHSPYSGGILVTITKEIKVDVTSPLFQVLFGNAYGSNIQRITENIFTVIAPPKTGNQNVLIKLIYDGKQINYSTAFFYYIDYQVTNIQYNPSLGTYKGGTLISITNDSEFLNSILYQCVFIDNESYSVNVDAFLIDSHHLGCITPQHAAGVLMLEINFDNYFITNLRLSFEFYLQIQLITFEPYVIYSYSECLLHLYAYNIIYNPLLMVKIGDIEINYLKVVKVSDKEYTVEIPRSLGPGEYDISISNINQNFEVFKIRHLVVLSILPIVINTIQPYIIPFNTKGTIMIKGKGFSYGHYYQNDLMVKIDAIDYKTKYINDTLITLDYPNQSPTLDGSIIEFGLSFVYNKCLYLMAYDKLIMYHDFTNAKFKPHFIQSYTEEMIIVSIGGQLINARELSCRLSILQDSPIATTTTSMITIQGIYININSYGCIIPKIHFGFYQVIFSQNAIDYIKSTEYLHSHIHIIKNIKLISLHPKIIPPGYKGMITIIGNNFVKYQLIHCQYQINIPKTIKLNNDQGLEGIYNEEVIIVNGYYLNQKVLLCDYPTGRLLGNAVYDITIQLTEGAIYGYEKISIFIYQSPPNGYYIDNDSNTIRRCEKGSHCSTYASYGNRNIVQCPYGYYQPFEGRSSCIGCPKGFLCDRLGLIDPSICSPGKQCIRGIEYDCPKGYYCTNGIGKSYYVSRYNYMNEEIQLCPVGTYCIGGVRIGSTVPNDYSTPQLCSITHLCTYGSDTPMGIGPCLSGHYCPNAKQGGIPCPYRSECSDRGNIRPLLCEPGYYGDRKGLHKCIECPLGYICPKKGMLKPEPCPAGYICDKRGIRYPYNFCKPGTVCFQGMKFDLNEKICHYSRICDSAKGDYIGSPMTSSEYIKKTLEYDENFHLFLCCYSNGKWKEMFTSLDKTYEEYMTFNQIKLDNNAHDQISFINSPHYSFSKYLLQFTSNLIDGYEVTMYYLENSLDFLMNLINIKIPFQRSYFANLLNAMYNDVYMFSPYPCPRKYYCLEGIASIKEIEWWSFTPRLCLVGYYCAGGAKYMSGTGPCPVGYHCEAGTDLPSLNPSSDVVETGCYPGTFVTSESVYSTCLSCPDGYECTEQGTYWPTICKEGFFRTIYDSCISCPKGTYSYEKGQKDSSQCVPCPAGKLCTSTSLNDPKLIKPCDEGTVCDSGSGLLPSYLCPSGYYCPTGTSPSTQYNNKCPEGYTCNKGTGNTNKSSQKCPINYYCPSGTESTLSLIPSCPLGTTSDDTQGLTSLLQCHTAKEHHLFTSRGIVNPKIRMLSGDNQNFYIDPGLPITKDILDYYNILNDYDLVTLELLKFSTASQPPSSINYNRKPLVSFSPFMLSKGLKPSHSITHYYRDIISLPFNTYYYHLSKNSYAYITFDFRHLANPEHFFIYGIDWDITFKKQFTLDASSTAIPLQIPELFLSKNNTKTKVHEFIIYTLEEIFLSVDINIYNSLFAMYSTFFNESAFIEEVKPNRAELNTDKFFGIIWERNEKVTLPANLPLMNNTLETAFDSINEKMEKNYIGYASSDLNITNQIVFGINYYQPQSQYWGNGESLGMVYIPYISNCKGYGRYLPLWALLEQSKSCQLISKEDTVFIQDFSFGVQSIGDNCTISLECIYDEDISKPSALGYWFEQKTGEKIFSITQNPIILDDLLSPAKSLELISVEVQSEIEYEHIPSEIILDINYFQQSQTVKKIIDAKMSFGKPIAKASILQGNKVHYNFKINYAPYSHTKLMVAFALSSKFYMVLYLIEGIITSFMVLTFFFYHRLMSRIDPRPIFKFWSFFPLIIPPVVIGWTLAIIPLLIIIFLIGILLTGKILFSSVILFNYVSANGIIYYSIFDFFEYNCNTSIELREIRNGRFGVSIIALGIFLIYYHTQAVIPNESTTHKKSYDNNLWHFINWKRMIVYYIDMFLIVINVYYTMLSFSSVWSDYIWYFIYSYKIVGILLENLFEEVFQEQLLISGLPCLFNIVQALLTFGAPTLIDFLNSAFIEQGGALVEKVYIESFTNFVKEHMDEYVEKIKKWIKKVLKYDLELESETKAQVDDDEEDDAIILSDEDENENNENNPNGDFKDKNKDKDRDNGDYSDNEPDNDLDNDDINSQSPNDHKGGKSKGKNMTKYPNAIEIEEFFDRYKGFGSDCLSYFINISFYLVLWIYYEEAHILENYDISKDNFIYFYYFTIITVPFCIVNDIILHNLMEEYANIQMHDFLDYVQYRYYIRNTSWALDDDCINFEVEFSVRKMYKLCFSSQYYYLKVHYIAGLLCLITGITGVMLNNINPFGDPATVFIFILVFIIVQVVKGLCGFLGRLIRLWQIESNLDEHITTKGNDTILNEKGISNKGKTQTGLIIKNYPPIVSVKNWEKIQFLTQQKELIEENLRTERLKSERTRKNFVNSNKIWLQNIITEIITPRSLIQNKEKIIDVLKKKYKTKEPNVDLDSINFYDSKHIEEEESYESKEFQMSFNEKFKEKKSYAEILRIWKKRSQLGIVLFSQVKLLVIAMKGRTCDNCGLRVGLSSVYKGDLIRLFYKFLEESNQDFYDYEVTDFKEFFKIHAVILTLCTNCI